MTGTLEGLTVVALEQAVAAPYATSRLADAGARVIKIERPTGDFARNYDSLVKGQSAYFVWLNRGKESVRIDLTDASDRLLLHKMIAKADVVVQNLKPGSTAKYGLDAHTLRAQYPDLITCTITGFGESGPFAHLKAYDLIVQAEVGLCAITGSPEMPARVGVSVCDIAAGMSAHASILEALLRKARTGQGASIDISLFDALADWMNVPYQHMRYGNRETQRAGVHHPSLAPYGAYTCADGTTLIFSVQNDREWVAFSERVLQRPTLTRDPRFADNMARISNRIALDTLIEARFGAEGSDQISAALEEAGIAWGRLNDLSGLISHPQIRKMKVGTPAGPIEIIAPAPIIDGQGVGAGQDLPDLGAQDAALREEFG